MGTDIEPLAVKATQSNAALNGVADALDAYVCVGATGWLRLLLQAAAAAGPACLDSNVHPCLRFTCCFQAAHANSVLADACLSAAASLEQQEPLAAAGVPEEQRQFEVTVANILQGPLVALAPRLAAYTKPGGLLGLSGAPGRQWRS